MRLPRAGIILATVGVAACDVPTGLPKYDMVWNVPAQSTSIAVDNFLPSGVSVTSDKAAFQVTTSPATTTITRTLGQDCAACAANNGLIIPKPAFVGGGTATVSLPANVTSATLVRDTLVVTLKNNLNFDPLRPSTIAGSPTGTLKIAVTSGSTALGSTTVDGKTTAFASGASLNVTIPLAGSVAGANGIVVATTLDSPAGDPVLMNSSLTSVVTAATALFYVSDAKVALTNQTVASQASTIDLSSIDNSVSDHADGGALMLTITNPFTATGSLQVKLTGGSTPITKTLNLAAGSSSPSIPFTQAELQSMFGHQIQLSLTGTVTGSSVTVTPGQTVAVGSRLQINVLVGSTN